MSESEEDYETQLISLHNELVWRRRHPEEYYDDKTPEDIEREIGLAKSERAWARRRGDI